MLDVLKFLFRTLFVYISTILHVFRAYSIMIYDVNVYIRSNVLRDFSGIRESLIVYYTKIKKKIDTLTETTIGKE